jgi:hypothetical protein
VREAFGERFDIRPGYLNTASIGVPSANTADRMIETITDWRTGAAQPAEFDADVYTARVAWARLVGASVDNVAIADLHALRAAAVRSGIRVLLDVTQTAGWMPRVDYVVGASYKWLLAPRGAAWLAVRPDRLTEVIPHAANWFAAEDPWEGIYGLPLRLSTTARRLDLSPVWFAHRGAATSLPWLTSTWLPCVITASDLPTPR